MITKEQEIRALATIRNICKSLGADSYVAIAFEGCDDIAEENIRNDSACSMKQRAESAEKELQEARARIYELENQVFDVRINIGRFQDMLKEAIEEKNQLIKQLLSREDKAFLLSLLNEKGQEEEQKISEASTRILEYADAPDCTEFKNAVRDRKAAISAKEYYEGVYDRLVYQEVCDEN